MLIVPGLRTLYLQATGEQQTEFVAQAPGRFVADQHTPRGHYYFHIPQADYESGVALYTVGDDLWEAVTTVRSRRTLLQHALRPDPLNTTKPRLSLLDGDYLKDNDPESHPA